MRHVATVCILLTVLASVASRGLAQPPEPKAKPADAASAAKTDPQALAQLRAEVHRTMAALIEARSAEKPNPAGVQKLTARLQELRGQMAPQRPAAAGPGWRCPWAGAGMGLGPAWGGTGRGPGAGGGRGPGFGPGPGFGRGFGPGPGFGRGPGAGRGPGYGRGAGWGPGAGRGPAFVDEDQDGICDNYERLWGKK